MITSLSKFISHFLCENNIFSEDDFPIYQYGFEMIISTILGFLITIAIGFLLNMKLLSVLYYIIFVFLRQLTGGYHADTYFKCNLSFAVLSFITMGMTKLIITSKQYNLVFFILLLVTSLAVIWKYSPIENKFKPLDENQKKRNHILSCICSITLSSVSCILYKYEIEISFMIILTLFLIAMLIVISKSQEGGDTNENS